MRALVIVVVGVFTLVSFSGHKLLRRLRRIEHGPRLRLRGQAGRRGQGRVERVERREAEPPRGALSMGTPLL